MHLRQHPAGTAGWLVERVMSVLPPCRAYASCSMEDDDDDDAAISLYLSLTFFRL